MAAAGTHTVFVVEDDEGVRDSMLALLEARDYAVKTFSSGREFLREHECGKADCVVMDVHMPLMTGLEVVREMRRTGDATPVILVTGRGDRAAYAEAKAMGVSLLDKPIPHALLMSTIERAIGGFGR